MLDSFAKETGVVRKIVLLDGGEWSGAINQATDYDDALWITLDEGPTMAEAFSAFNDPSKTRIIRKILKIPNSFFEDEKEYENFTELTDITIQGKSIQLRLRVPRKT